MEPDNCNAASQATNATPNEDQRSNLRSRKRSSSRSRAEWSPEKQMRRSMRALTRSNTRRNAQLGKEPAQDPNTKTEPNTPQKPKKRVRISDPGPQLLPDNDVAFTGLTPALLRTSFDENDSIPEPEPSTPSRSRRRRSAPVPGLFGGLDVDQPNTPVIVQFPPFRQILSARTKRRIARKDLSHEMNQIERERRQERSAKSELIAVKNELDALKKFNSERNDRSSVNSVKEAEEANYRIQQLEAEIGRLRGEISMAGLEGNNEVPEDTMMTLESGFDEETMIFSTSPPPNHRGMQEHMTSDSLSPTIPIDFASATADISTQANTLDEAHQAEVAALSEDLEAAKNEKRSLFHEWRTHIVHNDEAVRSTSPPPDFTEKLNSTLQSALARATDASQALDCLYSELSSLGFAGSTANEIVHQMRSQFRSARIELERAVPGETPTSSLENGNATLQALVERVKILVNDVEHEKGQFAASADRERALRGQFDACLCRYEAASQKIHDLEQTIETTADDMMHIRMQNQSLEREDQEKSIGVERLKNALARYQDDIKGLENLVNSLESQNTAIKERAHETITDLQNKVVQRDIQITELRDNLETNNSKISALVDQVDTLEKEHLAVTSAMESEGAEQSERHAQEVGALNARQSQLATSLADAKAEIKNLRLINARLRGRVDTEVDAHQRAIEMLQTENARYAARVREVTRSLLRGSRVRTANWEIEDEEAMETTASESVGNEPFTPQSMTRFVDVEVGRGKKRKRLDSGIGILQEEDEQERHEEEEQENNGEDAMAEGDSGIADAAIDTEEKLSPQAPDGVVTPPESSPVIPRQLYRSFP